MLKQKIISKYAKKFAAKGATDGVLEGVHYAADGSAVVTNREIALRICNAHNFEQPMTVSATTGTLIEGVYPSLDRVFDGRWSEEILLRPGPELETAIRSTRAALGVAELIHNKNFPVVNLSIKNGSANLFAKDDKMAFEGFFGNTLSADSHSERSLSAGYLLTALQVFADAGWDVTIHLGKPLEPILLTDGVEIYVLILPYRTAT